MLSVCAVHRKRRSWSTMTSECKCFWWNICSFTSHFVLNPVCPNICISHVCRSNSNLLETQDFKCSQWFSGCYFYEVSHVCFLFIYTDWLVVYLPLWKIWVRHSSSVGMMTFPIYGTSKNSCSKPPISNTHSPFWRNHVQSQGARCFFWWFALLKSPFGLVQKPHINRRTTTHLIRHQQLEVSQNGCTPKIIQEKLDQLSIETVIFRVHGRGKSSKSMDMSWENQKAYGGVLKWG